MLFKEAKIRLNLNKYVVLPKAKKAEKQRSRDAVTCGRERLQALDGCSKDPRKPNETKLAGSIGE